MKYKIKNFLKTLYSFFEMINLKYKRLYNGKLKKILQFFPSNIYLLLLFIILSISLTSRLLNNYTIIYSTGTGAKVESEIVDKSITQEIDTSNLDKIEAISIRFSTYMRKNKSKYEVLIYENSNVILKQKLDASKLIDNDRVLFKINKKVNKKNSYKFEVKPIDVKEGNGITVLKDKNDNYLYSIYVKSNFSNICIYISIALLIFFFIINYLINNNIIKKEENFYKLMLIYFIISVFALPPMFIPDANYHFKRGYVIGQNSIIDFIKTNNFPTKKEPININCLDYGKINGSYINVKDVSDIDHCFVNKKTTKTNEIINISNKIAYFISGLGIKIAMLFTNSPMIILFAGRLFNTICSFLIILYALKIVPKHKRIILSIVMIPVFIQQMCSYSYDSILNSLCILVICYLFKFFSDKEKIKIKDLVIYLISLIIILVIKMPYILIGLPIIFVDKNKFKTKKLNKIIYLIIMIVVMGIVYYIPRLEPNLATPTNLVTEARGMSINSLFDFKHLLHIIYNTIKHNTLFYIESFIGHLSWLDFTIIDKIYIYCYLFFICLGVMSEKRHIIIKNKYIVLSILINIILIGGIFLAMYLIWTTPSSIFIEGVQGRYLYAPILFIMLLLIPKNNKIIIENKTFYQIFNMSCIIYLITILYLFY